ncbi:MAG: DUF4932 domain-containing protein [Bacteroidales bacterium]|jgi:hypothetical protein|nr:DUF4932 domain-containing protein [Bacteroidales bacterium]
MKRTFIFVFIFFAFVQCYAQLQSHVDERVELTSLVFRLAGAEEYINNEVENYVKDADAYFEKYKSHELIEYVKFIRERDDVAYNAVAGVIGLLQIKNGKVSLAKNADIDCLLQDSRWKRETFLKFVNLLNKFYKDSKFQKFFDQHKSLYAETEYRFDLFLSGINTRWFPHFFGKPLNSPTIYVSLLNGTSNYGGSFSCSEVSDGYISIGCSQVDDGGIPVFEHNSDLFYTIVHELCHIFTNPLLGKYEKELSESGNLIFPYVKDKLENVAYGDAKTMLVEGFNNLFANMYCKETNFLFAQYTIRNNEESGFIWMRRTVKFMDNFYENKDLYSTINDFMPQLVEFMNFTAKNIEQVVFEYEHSNPYVVSVFPALNSTVSADIKEIQVNFSCPMWNSYGTSNSYDTTLISPIRDGKPKWSINKETLIIPVKLEKGKNYGFNLSAGIFQSFETYEMKENFEIKFSTER